MVRVFLLSLVMMVCAVGARGADVPDPGLEKPGWRLAWHDEFNGATADLDAGWEFQNGPQGHILCSRWRENVILENGLCRILNKKEKRGGQEWTSGCFWTKKQFKYGYFECRYRYGDAYGLNNSFWIMTRLPKEEPGRFEIDINEGHYPNEVNTNVHKWSGTHEGIARHYRIGARPDQSFVLKKPVETGRVRLVVRDGGQARVQEVRVLGADGGTNLALNAKATASSAMGQYPAEMAVDGKLGTPSRWVTAAGTPAPHTMEIDLGRKQRVGRVEVVSGWQNKGEWIDMLTDYSVEAWDGAKWVEIATATKNAVNLAREFHVYGLEWNEKELVYTFDGKVLRRQENKWCHREAPVWLSDAIVKWAGTVEDRIDGTTMDVDYVRVWEKDGMRNEESDTKNHKEGTKDHEEILKKSDMIAQAPIHSAFRIPQSALNPPQSDDLNLAAMIRPVPATAKFSDPDYYIWCGTMVKGGDGKCHLFYSRWPRKLGHNAWVTHSEVAHAVGDGPLGPFRHVDVALPPRGKEFWDGSDTHNPTVYHFDGKYYLYYTGNVGDGVATKGLNMTHRNHQRIGVAVAESPNGPWQRFDRPVIDVSPDKDAPDALMAANPAVTRRPDGGYLLVYKCVGLKKPLPFGGPVVHCVALADKPTGPFVKQKKLAFTVPGELFPAEDPFIWHDAGRGRYYAIVKDMRGFFTKAGKSLALFTSLDGLDWGPARHVFVSKTEIPWAEGSVQTVNSLERPQLFFDEQGKPVALLAASDETRERLHSFNVQIPLKEPPMDSDKH